MNPYNQPYSYSQHTPGPPQPQWQANPARRPGWVDPRFQAPSPISPYNIVPNATGPSLPPPPPPPSIQQPPPQFDSSAWGVRYNQGQAYQNFDPKPPLPPRPPSAEPEVANGFNYQQQAPQQHDSHAASQQYPTTWNNPYQSNTSAQSSTFPSPSPPPPPPRPAEYQAQIQAEHNRVNTPQFEYSHRPPSHHYDPPGQNTWNSQAIPSSGATYYPATSAPQIAAISHGPLVSPIDSNGNAWGQQGNTHTNQPPTSYQTSLPLNDRLGYSQALGFGGPSDWEHYEPGAPQDQTPTSAPAPSSDALYPGPGPVSPPQVHATPPASQTPKPSVDQPPPPIEMGVTSPVIARPESRFQSPRKQSEVLPPRTEERPPSAGTYSGNVSVRSDSYHDEGSIDNIIQVWNAPLKTHPGPEPLQRPGSRASAHVISPEASPTVRVVDPYADLEPEFRASLKRYAVMLRKESATDSDEQKFEIFQTFVTKELRLRSLLYGVELRQETKEVQKAASLADIQKVLPQPLGSASLHEHPGQMETKNKATEPVASPAPKPIAPQLPIREEAPQPPSVPASVQKVQHQIEIPKTARAVPTTTAVSTKLAAAAETPAKLESELSTNLRPTGEEEEVYSPGGRPKKSSAAPAPLEKPSINTVTQDKHRKEKPIPDPSPSAYAPMVIEDYATVQPPSPGADAPILVIPELSQPSSGRPSQANKLVVPIKFEPPRPAYTPFRYSAAVQEERTKPLQPADQSYSLLRNSVADSGRLMAQEALIAPVRPSSSAGRKEHEEAFIGLIRKQSMAVRQKTPAPFGVIRPGDKAARSNTPMVMRVGTPANTNVQPVDPLKQAVTALRSLLPKDVAMDTPQHPKLKDVKTKIDTVPDQFGFIHDVVVEWDRTNRQVREQQESERQARQEESEAHIDGLFNDNEIGYADIGELEAEFKLSEAERRYQENQEELESFTTQVFTPITERLQKEIKDLASGYTMAITLLGQESEPVSRCFKNHGDRAKMSEVMDSILLLFNKIEIRHRKTAEAHVERERRRKHLELTVLYTNGNTDAMKRLEKDFAEAEKAQVLHEAREKDSRANKLLDAFDRATVRGLGDNQMFVDDALLRLQELQKVVVSCDDASRSKLYEAGGPRDALKLAQSVVDVVKDDSRKILALSNEAEVLLNDSDYGVSVAEARIANADKATSGNLENEKAKEDAKLVQETNARIGSITKGPQEAIALIRDILDRIGDDPEHQERMKKALEAAKQRNASIDAAATR